MKSYLMLSFLFFSTTCQGVYINRDLVDANGKPRFSAQENVIPFDKVQDVYPPLCNICCPSVGSFTGSVVGYDPMNHWFWILTTAHGLGENEPEDLASKVLCSNGKEYQVTGIHFYPGASGPQNFMLLRVAGDIPDIEPAILGDIGPWPTFQPEKQDLSLIPSSEGPLALSNINEDALDPGPPETDLDILDEILAPYLSFFRYNGKTEGQFTFIGYGIGGLRSEKDTPLYTEEEIYVDTGITLPLSIRDRLVANWRNPIAHTLTTQATGYLIHNTLHSILNPRYSKLFPYIIAFSMAEGDIGSGDSGGPILLSKDGKQVLIGINEESYSPIPEFIDSLEQEDPAFYQKLVFYRQNDHHPESPQFIAEFLKRFETSFWKTRAEVDKKIAEQFPGIHTHPFRNVRFPVKQLDETALKKIRDSLYPFIDKKLITLYQERKAIQTAYEAAQKALEAAALDKRSALKEELARLKDRQQTHEQSLEEYKAANPVHLDEKVDEILDDLSSQYPNWGNWANNRGLAITLEVRQWIEEMIGCPQKPALIDPKDD